jgi:hypothetical protein
MLYQYTALLDQMAFRVKKTPGYTDVTAGEVIHLIKCIPAETRARQTNECHNELPVTYQNKTYFLKPRAKIVIKSGTPRDCDELRTIIFKIHDSWFRSGFYIHEPVYLATSRIYTTSGLERLRSHIAFPVEKPSM